MKEKHNLEFLQQDKPVTREKDEPLDPNADYTKETELKALASRWPCLPEHKV